MERIRLYLFNKFYSLFPTFFLTATSLLLLMIRLKLTHSFFLVFLVWNLFLAAIPYLITTYLSQYKKVTKGWIFLCTIVWLVFLPNAPYIITDFIHLTHLQSNMKILDTMLISTFALSGLLFYAHTMNEMKQILTRHFSPKLIRPMFYLIPFLCGFGIYLGRFLRWNSWDLIQEPWILFSDIWNIIAMPWSYKGAWLVTICFGIGLILVQNAFNKIYSREIKRTEAKRFDKK